MRVGAIDCGTNSIRLLVADGDPAGLEYVERRTEIVRLGQGVDVTGRIADEAMVRTLHVTAEYARICRETHTEQVRFVATSASRDAQNAAEFVAGVRAAFAKQGYDVAPEVVPGDEEAQLSFTGATGELRANRVAAPYLVVDLGGGSTELVRGTDVVDQGISLNIGSVRMTERHLHTDPPSSAEISAATVDIDAALDEAERTVDLSGIATLVGLAGTITTVTAHALELERYDSTRVHGAVLTVEQVLASCDAIMSATAAQLRAMPFMHPGRVDVISAGALIWSRIVTRLVQRSGLTTVRTSETDILDGIALGLVE